MGFIRDDLSTNKVNDTVFAVLAKANADNDPSKVNATIGSLCDEDAKLVAYDSFFNIYNALDNRIKAKYAESFSGNKAFNEAVCQHILKDKIKLPYSCVATSGGSGAVTITIKDILKRGQTLLIPEIGWGSYKLMAAEYGINVLEYDIYNLDDLADKALALSKNQDKVLMVINAPSHNPCGVSYSIEEWKHLVDRLNEITVPTVILNDIAYIDYCYDVENSRNYLECFNSINDNLCVVIAFSLSKTMTSYGLRCGATIIINKNAEDNILVRQTFEKSCRAIWSNINNAAMVAFAEVYNKHYDEFLKEKAQYIKLLRERADIFIKEADEVGLEYYPYTEGFFITIKALEDKEKMHQTLIDNHIYTVQVNKGLRIAICSVPKSKIKGLARRIKEILA